MYQQEHYLNESYDIEETRVDGTVNYLPEGNVLLCQINETITHTFALCLFDSGSTTNLLNQRALPVGITPLVLGPPQRFTTTQGTYSSPKYVKARNMSFPEFYKTRKIPFLQIRLFDSPSSRYDVIVGRDVLAHGFILDHARRVVTWDDLSIPMVPTSALYDQTIPTYFNCACTYGYGRATQLFSGK